MDEALRALDAAPQSRHTGLTLTKACEMHLVFCPKQTPRYFQRATTFARMLLQRADPGPS